MKHRFALFLAFSLCLGLLSCGKQADQMDADQTDTPSDTISPSPAADMIPTGHTQAAENTDTPTPTKLPTPSVAPTPTKLPTPSPTPWQPSPTPTPTPQPEPLWHTLYGTSITRPRTVPSPPPEPEKLWCTPYGTADMLNTEYPGLLPEVDEIFLVDLITTQRNDLLVAYEELYQYHPKLG